MAMKLKFKECGDCLHKRTRTCLQCGAGEFFEEKDEEVPTDDELLEMSGERDD